MKENKALQHYKSDYKAAEVVKNENDEKVAKWLDIKDSKPYGTEVAHKSKYVSDMTRKLLNWQIPSIVDPLVSTKDLINCAPYTHADRAISEQEESVLTHQFIQRMNHYEFITDLVTIVSEQGTCFVKTGWDFQEEEQEVEKPLMAINPMDGQEVIVGYEYVKEMVTIKNEPTREICDLLDIRMDPTCKGNIAKASFVIHDFETDLSSLRADGRYKNLDEVMNQLERDETYQHRDTTDSTFRFEDDARKKIIVHEYWGKYDLNDDGIAEPVVCAWIGDVIIREEENPLPGQEIPFEKAVYTRIPDAIYGEPLAALTKKKQHIDSVLNRGIFDDMKLANNGQTGTKKGFTDDQNLRNMKQGKDFEYNTTMADVYQDTYRPINNSVFQVMSNNAQDGESITGVSAFNHGTGGNALGSSAAAVNATTTSSAKREMHIVRGIAETCIIPILKKFSRYNREFLSPEEVQRITDKPYVEPSNDVSFDVKMNLESAESRAAKAQSTGFVLQTMGPNMPQEQQQTLLSRYMKLVGEPDIAKQIAEFQPQPDPMQMKMQELQIAKLEAEIANERAKGMENQVDVALKQAKTQTEIAKAKDLNEGADLKSQQFLDNDAGVSHSRDMEKQYQKSQADIDKQLIAKVGM